MHRPRPRALAGKAGGAGGEPESVILSTIKRNEKKRKKQDKEEIKIR